MRDQIDIIIPVLNSYSIFKNCVEAIIKYTDYPYKLIIINDGTKDNDTVDYLNQIRKRKNVVCINNETTLGKVKSINIGIGVSDADTLVIMDDDIIVSSRWIIKLKAGFDFSEKIGIVGSLHNDSNSKKQAENMLLNSNFVLDKIWGENFYSVPFILGTCMMVKRKVFNRIGYFDEIFNESIFGYFSDIDLCFRAIKFGYDIGVCKNLFVYHYDVSHY